MPVRDVRDSHLQTIIPVLAVILPVSGALVMDHAVFRRFFELPVMDLLSEIFCMLIAVALACFMLLRYAGMRLGLHFWFGCGLVSQGIMLGYHALNIESPAAPVFQVLALFLGSALASLGWMKPGRRCHRLERTIPLAVVVGSTLLGMLLLADPAWTRRFFGSLNESSLLTVLLWASVAINLLVSVRFATSYLRCRVPSLLWISVFTTMTLAASVIHANQAGISEGWEFHLLRVSAFMILLAYVATVTTREVNRLGHTESALQRSEAHFKAITENTADIIFVMNEQGVFTYVSPSAARVVGAEVEDMMGLRPGTYTHSDDAEKVSAGLEEAKARPGETVNIGTIRVRSTSGNWVNVEGVYTCLFQDPSVEGIVMNYRDVTDRIVYQTDLEQSRQRMSRLITNLPGLVYRCGVDGGYPVQYVSDFCFELIGYHPSDLMSGKVKARDFIHVEDIDRMRSSMKTALESRKPYRVEYRVVTNAGDIRRVMERGVGIYGDDGEMKEIEGIILDITDLVESRRELRRSKFSMENANDALLWIASDGRLVEVNDTACRYLGYTRSELLGLRIHDIATDIHEDNWNIAWECVRREGATLIDSIYKTKTGRRFPVEVSSIFLDFEGEESHCCFVRDITERKEAERQIQKMNQELEERVRERTIELEEAQARLVTSEKFAALGSLVAGVAHEINTPLGIGVTAASHMDKKVAECGQLYRSNAMRKSDFENFLGLAAETSSLILSNLRRAADLVQGFKQVSVDQSSERRRMFALNEYLGEVVASLRPEFAPSGHDVILDCSSDQEMDSYPGSLAQVLTNLIMNSVKHGFEGRRDGRIWLSVDGDESVVRVLYKDNGIGMDAEQVRRLYDPFYTTKRGRGGSGLGMNITYNLITQVLKGTIECQSAPGQGTVFMLEFPRVTPVDAAAESDGETAELPVSV